MFQISLDFGRHMVTIPMSPVISADLESNGIGLKIAAEEERAEDNPPHRLELSTKLLKHEDSDGSRNDLVVQPLFH